MRFERRRDIMADFTAKDGRVFRVQFVHSAHDQHQRIAGTPGSHRQLVDNIAASLHRRVTLCEVSEVQLDPVTKHEDGTPVKQVTPLAQGLALCHHNDQFVKRVGRAYALVRALALSGLEDEVCVEIAEFCGFDLGDIS
jgi:hypothetical protein